MTRRFMLSSALLLALGGLYALYLLSIEVHALERRYAGLTQQLAEEREAIRVLEAEWAYLNRPDNLNVLGLRIGLEPLRPDQVLRDLDEVPILDPDMMEGLPRPIPRGGRP